MRTFTCTDVSIVIVVKGDSFLHEFNLIIKTCYEIEIF